jgi:capsular polysaccharide biosynthesis protein
MELRRYLAILSKRWLLIIVTVAVALGIAYVSTPKTHYYVARSTIVVGPRSYTVGGSTTGSADVSGDTATGIAVLVATYADLIPTVPIATEAVQLTGVPRTPLEVVAETKASEESFTQVLNISVTDPSAAVAQALATGMAQAFVAKVNSFSPTSSPTVGTIPSVPVYVFETAQLPTDPLSTGLKSNLVIAGIFGLLGALGLVTLLEYLDITIKSAADAERRLGLPVLGAIPLIADAGPERYASPAGHSIPVEYRSVQWIEAGRS